MNMQVDQGNRTSGSGILEREKLSRAGKTFFPPQEYSRAQLRLFSIKGWFWFFLAFAMLGAGNLKAQARKPWKAPESANFLKNPLAGNKAVLADAKKLYTTFCSPCHGITGKGNGLAASSLNPKPADHTSARVQAQSDGALYWKMTQGRAPMPSYKLSLTDRQRWELVDYIRSLARHH